MQSSLQRLKRRSVDRNKNRDIPRVFKPPLRFVLTSSVRLRVLPFLSKLWFLLKTNKKKSSFFSIQPFLLFPTILSDLHS